MNTHLQRDRNAARKGILDLAMAPYREKNSPISLNVKIQKGHRERSL